MASIFRIPTSSDVPPTGYWGMATAVHQFCEPKYATSHYVAEFYNSISSFLYVFCAAYVLSKREARQDPMILLTTVLVAIIGIGSVLFHGTMLFEYELWDEVPMLLVISIGMLNKCFAHPLLLTRGRCLVFGACVICTCAATIVVYAKLQIYEFFVGAFTVLVIVDTALACTWRSRQRVTTWAMYMSAGCIVVGKLVWEVEVRCCAADKRVWPLHVVWHGLSCACVYYGVLADMASRIDCGLSPASKGEALGQVPISWAGVPFTEVRVVEGSSGSHRE